jgi:indole-3-glycerol phosphate synthase
MEGELKKASAIDATPRLRASHFDGVIQAGGVLDRIVEAKAVRVLKAQSAEVFEPDPFGPAVASLSGNAFLKSISVSGRVNVIAEIKRRSPSKGLIRADFDPVRIAEAYHWGGAAALSILTEEDFFDGSLDFLRAVSSSLPGIPLLRKDFIFAESQVYESRAAGADAMLLITAILGDPLLSRLIGLAIEQGVAPLVEVHSEREMKRALAAGATIIGVNNRDLTDFSVSLDTSLELAAMAPPGVTLISESGINTGDDVARLRDVGYSAFLVGEHLMRAADPGQALSQLIAGAHGSACSQASAGEETND